MTNIIADNLTLVIILPLWLFLIIMLGRFFSVYVHKTVIHILTLLSSFLGGITCITAYFNINNSFDWTLPFIKINNFVINFGIHVDKLSVILGALLFIISFFVQIFSVFYMKEEKKEYRFFALLNLFNFSMAFLIFSPNLFQFYAFWELVSIVSYLLIGFDYNKREKSIAAKRVFILNRVGDCALIGAIIFASYFMYNYTSDKSFSSLSFEDINSISLLLSVYAPHIFYKGICILFIVGAMVKSAQFPFHTWLQDAMEAKLPVSALLHSATMVVAGVYLIMKLMPLFTLDSEIMQLISFIGLTTAIICSVMAVFETHPKKVLAYSTSANLGMMFWSLGTGNIQAALIFLLAHAIIKSSLFLSLPKENGEWSYTKFALFVLNVASLGGLLFAGFISKEILYNAIYHDKIAWGILVFLTPALYMSKLAYTLYKKSELSTQINWGEILPIVLLFVINIAFYPVFYSLHKPSIPILFIIIFIVLGILTSKITVRIPKFIELINNEFVPYIYEKIANITNYIEQKVFQNYRPIISLAKYGILSANKIEEKIMNQSVIKITELSKSASKLDSIIQSKNVQSYNAYAFIIISVIITVIMLIIGRVS